MITIVDYGMGNVGSIVNMFKKVGVLSTVTKDIEEINNAKKLLLPGVGSFDKAISTINSLGLREVLNHQVLTKKTPILGICLGMQLLTDESEEGILKGFGWIPAKTIKFSSLYGLKIPHMGWNEVHVSTQSPLTQNMLAESRFYFVHSYHVKVQNEENSILKTNYGLNFDSAIQKDNIFGVQFHPEKSHKFGIQLLKNFANL